MNTIDKVFDSFNSQVEMAKALRVGKAVVNNWKRRKKIPIEHVAEISRLTGIPAKELRPDVWEAFHGKDEAAA